jgi:hypothetical protein
VRGFNFTGGNEASYDPGHSGATLCNDIVWRRATYAALVGIVVVFGVKPDCLRTSVGHKDYKTEIGVPLNFEGVVVSDASVKMKALSAHYDFSKLWLCEVPKQHRAMESILPRPDGSDASPDSWNRRERIVKIRGDIGRTDINLREYPNVASRGLSVVINDWSKLKKGMASLRLAIISSGFYRDVRPQLASCRIIGPANQTSGCEPQHPSADSKKPFTRSYAEYRDLRSVLASMLVLWCALFVYRRWWLVTGTIIAGYGIFGLLLRIDPWSVADQLLR